MSVTPTELLQLARSLDQTAAAEVDFRNVIGRAYYAAYHEALAFHATLPTPGQDPPQSVGIHAALQYRLLHPSIHNSDPRHDQSKRLSLKLKPFHRSRASADYRLDITISQTDARDALIKAAEIFRILGRS